MISIHTTSKNINNYYRKKILKIKKNNVLSIILEWAAIFLGLVKYEILLLLENI